MTRRWGWTAIAWRWRRCGGDVDGVHAGAVTDDDPAALQPVEDASGEGSVLEEEVVGLGTGGDEVVFGLALGGDDFGVDGGELRFLDQGRHREAPTS